MTRHLPIDQQPALLRVADKVVLAILPVAFLLLSPKSVTEARYVPGAFSVGYTHRVASIIIVLAILST